MLAGMAAQCARQQVQQDKGASATVTILRRMAADTSLSALPPDAVITECCSASLVAVAQSTQNLSAAPLSQVWSYA